MAHGFLQSLSPEIRVYSAGTAPAERVNMLAVKVMREAGIDIRSHYPKSVGIYLNDEWDYVITVCDSAKETCPVFSGKVRHSLHFGFDDPSLAKGTPEQVINEFRRVRDQIRRRILLFYNELVI